MMRPYLASLGIVASVLLCGVARAAESEPKPAALPEPNSGVAPTSASLITIDVWAGGGVQEGNTEASGILAFGATILLRNNWLTIGMGGEVGGAISHAMQEYLSVLAGPTWDLASWFRLETLGAVGLHFEQPSSGTDFFGAERRIVGGDESVALPHLGVRVTPTFVLGAPQQEHGILGVLFEVKQDIGSRAPHYLVETCMGGQPDGGYSCSTDEESYRTGGFHFTVGARLAVEFGVGG